MKISVVTPSYNQGDFLEETIKSVISQNVDDLEYIVIDGGSTDNSVDIIRKYENHIKYWVSEVDEGQPDAIVKGFEKATGDILCYLNSDDVFMDGVLKKVEKEFENSTELELLYGDMMYLYPGNRLVSKPKISFDFDICLNAFMIIPQPASFWTRRIYDEIGGIKKTYEYCFDYEFYLNLGQTLKNRQGSIKHVHDLWAKFRIHKGSKTVSSFAKLKADTRLIRRQFNFISNPLIRPFIKFYYLTKTLYVFYRERGFIPLSPGPERLPMD